MTPLAIVIRPSQLDLTVQGQQLAGLVRMEFGSVLTVRACHTRTYVPLFFRLARLACRTSLVRRCPASRNSYSTAPNSSASGTSTARSTRRRTASSTLGRSCSINASIRSSRLGSAARFCGARAMEDLLASGTPGVGLPPPHYPTPGPANFPPKYQLHTRIPRQRGFLVAPLLGVV